MNYYYLDADNTPVGPVKANQVIELVSSQDLTLESLVAQEGSKEWLSLRELLPTLTVKEEALPPVPQKALTPPPLPQPSRQNILENAGSLGRAEQRELREIQKGKRREADGKKYFFGKKVTWEGVSGVAIVAAIFCGQLAYRKSVVLGVVLALVLIPLVYGVGWLLIKHYDDI